MIPVPPSELETARLKLRRLIVEDAEAIFRRYATDFETIKYLTFKPHQDVAQARHFIKESLGKWESKTEFTFGIIYKEEQQLIGCITIRSEFGKVDFGYVLSRDYWGRGLMTEAVQKCCDWALAQPSIFRVWAVCDIENRASARVMEKVGMQREGILRRWNIHPNISPEPRDCWCYAKVKF